jgi:anaerobic dimethyl sulfoxide reductase subunit C (anchor subunit)
MGRGEVKPAWSLVFFTVLTQAAVGIQILLMWYGEAIRQCASPAAVEPLVDAARMTILVLLAPGMACAALHLRRPEAARYALSNLRSSRLSQELLLVLLFGVAVAGQSAVKSEALDWLCSLIGICVVLSMARVYMIRTVPMWNSSFTPIGFFFTTFLLGAAVLADLLARAGADRYLEPILRLGSLAVILPYGQIILTVVTPFRTKSRGGVWYANPRDAYRNHRVILIARILLALIGSAAVPDTMFRHATVTETSIAVALLLAGELLGRYLFYAMHRRVGL